MIHGLIYGLHKGCGHVVDNRNVLKYKIFHDFSYNRNLLVFQEEF